MKIGNKNFKKNFKKNRFAAITFSLLMIMIMGNLVLTQRTNDIVEDTKVTKEKDAKTIDYENELQVSSQATNICISEVVSNGGQGGNAEWIELYNPIGDELNLSGWEVDDGNNNISLSPVNISAYGVITVGDDDADTDFNITMSLKDDKDWVLLRNSTRDIVDAVLYGSHEDLNRHKNTEYWDSSETVEAPDDPGESIQRINLSSSQGLEDNNVPSDWSLTTSPTPGELPNPTTEEKIYLTEVVSKGGQSGSAEWIELYNPTGLDLYLNGWEIDDGSDNISLSPVNISAYGVITVGD
ncbi:MAG: lamin tail domain-containing protein, partial [Promethearchaeia archaeon]